MATNGQHCPRCGMLNPIAATFCVNPACQALIAHAPHANIGPIASDAHRDPETQKPGLESPSLTDSPKTASETPTRDSFGGGSDLKSGNRPGHRKILWGMVALILVSGPGAWGWGYLHGLHIASGALRTPTVTKAPALHPSRSVPPSSTPDRSPTPSPRITHTPSPRVVVPVRKVVHHTTAPTASALPPGMAELTGTIKNGQLQAIVWASISANGPWYPVSLMVDTGAEFTMVSGEFFKACGDQPTGQTATFSGIGGNENVAYWPHVWLAPTSSGAQPIFANQVEPGGVGRSMLGNEGITILLGQNVLTTGTLTQTGNTWTLIYPVEN